MSVGVDRGRSGSGIPTAAIVLGVVVLIELVLLAALPYLATTDGPIHIGSAAALRDFLTDPNGVQHAYQDIYWFPVPNLIPEIILAALLTVTDPGVAEKLFVAGYVIGLPFGMYWVIGAIDPRARWLALVGVPLTFNASLHFGFFNFCFGVVAFLLVAGYFLRHRELARGRERIAFGVAMFVVYLTHVVPFVEAVMLTGIVVLTDWARSTPDGRSRARRLVERGMPWLIAVGPSVLLAAVFFVAGGTGGSDYRRDLPTLLFGLPSLAWPIVSYDKPESVWTVLVGIALFVAVVAALLRRRPLLAIRPWDWALGFTIIGTLAYLIAPESLGSGGVVSQRLALFPIMGVVFWLAGEAATMGRRPVALVAGAAIVTAAGLFVMRIPSYTSTSDAVADYVSIEPCIVPGSTMAQANLSWFSSGPLERISPLIHDAGRLAAATNGLDLGSITGSVPLFPLQNLDRNDPFVYLITRKNGEYEIPGGLDPAGYEAATDGRLDYVIVFGRDAATSQTLASDDWRDLSAQLAADYRLVGVSPTGRVELYERDVPDLAQAGDAHRAAEGSACPVPSTNAAP